jgi:hypothetical protein
MNNFSIKKQTNNNNNKHDIMQTVFKLKQKKGIACAFLLNLKI